MRLSSIAQSIDQTIIFFRLILEKNYLKLNKADTELVICINIRSDTNAPITVPLGATIHD